MLLVSWFSLKEPLPLLPPLLVLPPLSVSCNSVLLQLLCSVLQCGEGGEVVGRGGAGGRARDRTGVGQEA